LPNPRVIQKRLTRLYRRSGQIRNRRHRSLQRDDRKRCALIAGLAFLLLLRAPPGARALPAYPLGAAIEAIEHEHDLLCPAETTEPAMQANLSRLAEDLRGTIDRAAGAASTVRALNEAIFGRLGITGSPDLKDPCNLLPSRVIERKRGYCVGIAALYLVLAERLDLPIYAAATPTHVFLRYDDGASRINIETLQRGASVPDQQYVREQKIPEISIGRGVFMRNLTVNEFLAQVHNNLGVIYSEKGSYGRADAEYREAIDLDPGLAVAYYNKGNDLLRLGDYRPAVRFLTRSLRLYPTDVWALNNRGLAYEHLGKLKKAGIDLRLALETDPAFETARVNLQRVEAEERRRTSPH